MNRNATAAARAVANGTATTQESKDFRAAALALGWTGVRGLGVVNHASNERVQSYRLLAQFLLEEAGDTQAELDRVEEAEAEEIERDNRAAAVTTIRKILDIVADPNGAEEPAISFSYVTATEAIPVSHGTQVITILEHEATAMTEGVCVSGAALDCAGEGFLRVLPESMLPGQERERMIQCLPCYEASAAAYARKLHGATRTEV